MNADLADAGPAGGASADEAPARFGLLACAGTAASVAMCYAEFLADLLAPVAGAGWVVVNEHVQAVAMWAFAAVAVLGLALDRRRHGGLLPLALGAAGLLVIVATLYAYYDVRILVAGYILLVAGALLNQNQMLGSLYGTVQRQAGELLEWNSSLEQRVESQVSEIERLGRLRRFLAPEVADLITTEGKETLLDSHRRYIACLFCDMRDFTMLSESLEPEEVMEIVQVYHERLGRLAATHGGTIGYRAGDGLMVFFNDPIPCEDPVLRAVRLALDMREAFEALRQERERLGYRLGFGIGIASGYATLGIVGVEGGADYTAIGSAVNVAARLCDMASNGEIIVSHRAFADVDGQVDAETRGEARLKGVAKPVPAYNILRLTGQS